MPLRCIATCQKSSMCWARKAEKSGSTTMRFRKVRQSASRPSPGRRACLSLCRLEARHDLGPQRIGKGFGGAEFERIEQLLRRIENGVVEHFLGNQLIGACIRRRIAVCLDLLG